MPTLVAVLISVAFAIMILAGFLGAVLLAWRLVRSTAVASEGLMEAAAALGFEVTEGRALGEWGVRRVLIEARRMSVVRGHALHRRMGMETQMHVRMHLDDTLDLGVADPMLLLGSLDYDDSRTRRRAARVLSENDPDSKGRLDVLAQHGWRVVFSNRVVVARATHVPSAPELESVVNHLGPLADALARLRERTPGLGVFADVQTAIDTTAQQLGFTLRHAPRRAVGARSGREVEIEVVHVAGRTSWRRTGTLLTVCTQRRGGDWLAVTRQTHPISGPDLRGGHARPLPGGLTVWAWNREHASIAERPRVQAALQHLAPPAYTLWIGPERLTLLLDGEVTDPTTLNRWIDWLVAVTSAVEGPRERL